MEGTCVRGIGKERKDSEYDQDTLYIHMELSKNKEILRRKTNSKSKVSTSIAELLSVKGTDFFLSG